MLANTVHLYPVLLMGGWIGITGSMLVELLSLLGYLHRSHRPQWIFRRFVAANAFSAIAGLCCFVILRHPPSGTAADNARSLVLGVGLAFLLTVVIERTVFCWKIQLEHRKQLTRAVVMSNAFSYAFLVGFHLFRLS